MPKFERLDKIQKFIDSKQYVSLNDIVKEFNISKSTSLRYIQALSNQKRTTLIRGGAVSNIIDTLAEPSCSEKLETLKAEKHRIALEASKFIQTSKSIFIDSSTTCRELTNFLDDIDNLHILTNDVMIAAELSYKKNISINVLGGTLRNGYSLSGLYAENMIKNFRVDIAFVGIDSVDLHQGCMISNENEVGIKRAITEICNKVILLCDHSKFRKDSFISVFPISSVSYFITGKDLDPKIYGSFVESGSTIILV